MTKRRFATEPRRFWSPDEDALLVARYPHEPTVDLVRALPGRTLSSVFQRARTLKLYKSAAFLASPLSGRTDGKRGEPTRFKAGHTTWNKGQRFVAGGRSAETRFTRGQMPHNAVPIGTRAKVGGYWKIKVAEPKVWRWVHRMTWEDANGPIPRGSAVVFADGNPDHCDDLTNLRLATRSEIMRRNTIHNYPQPIPQLTQLRGALVRKLNRREREKQA